MEATKQERPAKGIALVKKKKNVKERKPPAQSIAREKNKFFARPSVGPTTTAPRTTRGRCRRWPSPLLGPGQQGDFSKSRFEFEMLYHTHSLRRLPRHDSPLFNFLISPSFSFVLPQREEYS